jgi:hypothetical protein
VTTPEPRDARPLTDADGADVVVEGAAAKVGDGPPPCDGYEVTPATAFSFGTEESFGPTRYAF